MNEECLPSVGRPLQRFKSNSSLASIFAPKVFEDEAGNNAAEELSDDEGEAMSDEVLQTSPNLP